MKSIFILAFLLPFSFFAQYRFDVFGIENGLVENSVTEIFQDRDEYIWISTQDGISRYNGYDFKSYNLSNNKTTSLSDNYLWGFVEDSLGFIWCCSRNGLNRIDKKTSETTCFYLDTLKGVYGPNQFMDIVIYKGFLYASNYEGVYQIPIKRNYPKRTNQLTKEDKIKHLQSTTYCFLKDKKKDEVYFLTEKGLFHFNEKRNVKVKGFSENLSHAFLKMTQQGDTLWIMDGTKVFYYHTKTGLVEELGFDFSKVTIHDLLILGKELWVATNNGVYIFYKSSLVNHIIEEKDNKNGLPSNYISSLFEDKSGKIWVGTSGRGFCTYSPRIEKFKYLSKETFGANYMVRSIVQDSSNRLIVCTNNKIFVAQLKKKQFNDFVFASQNIDHIGELRVPGITKILPTKVIPGHDGDFLVGTKGNGILILDKNFTLKKKVTLNLKEGVTDMVSDVVMRENENFWISTYYGVYVLNKNYELKVSFLPNDRGLSSNYFLSVFEDADDQVWLGSNTGIYKYIEEENMFLSYPYRKHQLELSPGFNFVCGFTDFNDGFLWMATYGGGLSKMEKKTGKFVHYTMESGLSSNVCNGILADGKEQIWLNTNKGISVLNRKTQEIRNYSQVDGLHFSEMNLNSFYKSSYGEMFFGTVVGLVLFNPEDISISNHLPNIVIDKVDINYADASNRIVNEQIDLYPNDKAVTFYYAGMNFSNSPNIKYKYKLQGYNEDWVETKGLIATYTSLPQGGYSFMVNTTNEDGIWNENPKRITVIVHPPFYKTWWFLLFSGLLLLGSISLVVRYFSQRKIKKRLQELKIQQEVHKEKQRISRDLHDNIGSQITYLISSIDKESYSDKGNQDILEKLSDKARTVMTHLRQTIWVINKEAITPDDFIQKIQDYSSQMLAPQNIAVYIQSENKGSNYLLPPSIVNQLFRVIQEANNNIIKHAKAKEVYITMKVGEGDLSILIQDDGVGLSTQQNWGDDHFGLKNMRNRIEELNGEFSIRNRTDTSGTEIKVRIRV